MKQTISNASEKMTKTVDSLARDFAAVRAGRANPAVLDPIKVEYYGTPTPISQIASVAVPEGHTILIQPWDATALKDIEKAINMSDLGINPVNDGKSIRLVFPPLTEERRKELVKEIRKTGENAKVAVRNIRRDAVDAIKNLKKQNEITEDDQKGAEKDIQDLTDKNVKTIDNMIADKEKELMAI